MASQNLTTAEAADELGVTPSLVCLWCREGRIPAAKFGVRNWVIPVGGLRRFAKKPRKTGRPAKWKQKDK